MTMNVVSVEEAALVLAAGGPVIFPTETVLGIGVSVAACSSPAQLYHLKDRPATKPIAWLIADCADLDRYGASVSPAAHRLAHAFWPGSLTLIVSASSAVPRGFQSDAGTIGLRMPANCEALDLIRSAGAPLATTSANPSGAPAPRTLAELDAAFAERTGTVVAPSHETDDASSGVASTIVDCTGGQLRIVRVGGISQQQIAQAACADGAAGNRYLTRRD